LRLRSLQMQIGNEINAPPKGRGVDFRGHAANA
jgi:hypothetical protein